MKRFLLIAGAAALLMTSCSEEKFLNDSGLQQANTDGNSAITFQGTKPNQSRSTTNLETATTNFGIYGVKANNMGDLPQLPTTAEGQLNYQNDYLIFNNYLVGHNSTYPLFEGGYTEQDNVANANSFWYYEGLGYDEYPTPTGVTESAWDKQYLKYWDANKTCAYFVAYTPYQSANPPVLKAHADGDADHIFQLEYQQPISLNDEVPFMFAAKQELVSEHTTKDANGKYVPVELSFKRCQSQIRIAFYEVIKGYKVQMINQKNNSGYSYGVTAMPYSLTKADHKGSITTSGKPIVKFLNPTGSTPSTQHLTGEISFQNITSSDDFVFNFPVSTVYLNNPNGTATEYLHEVRAEKAFSNKVYNVFPNSTGDALQFVLSFKLIAEDTGEEITVNQARINIPNTYLDWKANCLYTYVFKITKDTNGSTTPATGEPDVPEEPDPDPALYPIIFDNLVVEEMLEDGNTKEYTLYDSAHSDPLAPSATEPFIFQSGEVNGIPKDYAEVGLNQSLELKNYMVANLKTKLEAEKATAPAGNLYSFQFTSDNTAIAEVDPKFGTVTGKQFGSTTIHVVYTDLATGATSRDAMIIYVVSEPTFLSSSQWACVHNTSYSLSSLLKVAGNIANVTWTINGVALEAENINNTEFNYTADAKKIKFLKVGETYLCKAVYDDGTDTATDYFFVTVTNSFLKTFKERCVTATAYNLNDYVSDSATASSITWSIGSTALTDPVDNDNFSYAVSGSDKNLTFKTAGTYTLSATYGGNTENITVIVKAAPTPSTPGE